MTWQPPLVIEDRCVRCGATLDVGRDFDNHGPCSPIEHPAEAEIRRLRAALAQPEPLDAAWKTAEAALPEGWHICAVERHCHVGDEEPGEFGAYTVKSHDRDRWEGQDGHGPTPAAALLALAARLSETPR